MSMQLKDPSLRSIKRKTMDETRKCGIKGAQETLVAMTNGFKALGQNTKPR